MRTNSDHTRTAKKYKKTEDKSKMKKSAKERKRRERALTRCKKKSWVTERLKNKRIYLDLLKLNKNK